MEGLRTPFFIVAIVLSVVVVLLELGKVTADALIKPPAADLRCTDLSGDAFTKCSEIFSNPSQWQHFTELSSKRPPGQGIPYLALLDSVMVFTLGLMGASLVINRGAVGRVQGCATLIYSILLILLTITLIFAALGLLILMVSLFLAVPFGTLVYLAIYGFFDKGGASIILSLLMILKLAMGGSLVLAHQRFLENRGLVLLVLTSVLGNVIISFLHGFLPSILVSITDAIGAICVGILAIIWGVLLLIGAIISILKILRPS